jgi:chromate transporter
MQIIDLLRLCFEFFKTGLFAVGGGLATLPFLSQMSDKYPHWFTQQMLATDCRFGSNPAQSV